MRFRGRRRQEDVGRKKKCSGACLYTAGAASGWCRKRYNIHTMLFLGPRQSTSAGDTRDASVKVPYNTARSMLPIPSGAFGMLVARDWAVLKAKNTKKNPQLILKTSRLYLGTKGTERTQKHDIWSAGEAAHVHERDRPTPI